MKRMIAAIALTIMMMSHTSRAEEKLFITDVLEEKEMEASASFSYFHSATEISSPSATLNADQTVDVASSRYSFNVGLGHGFEVGARIPYIFSRRVRTQYPTIPSTTIRFSEKGFGDLSLGGKYRIFSETDKPFALVAGLGVKLETAPEDDGGTGTTNIMPFVAASTTVGENIRPYAIYEAIVRNHGRSDTHAVLLGAEKELNQNVGLRASLEADFHTSSDNLESHESYHLTLTSYIRICGDFYVIPAIDYGIHSSTNVKDADGRFESSTSTQVQFGFYYLF